MRPARAAAARVHIGGKQVLRETGFASGERLADVAQLVERVLGKDEVTGSIPVIGSRIYFGGGSNSVVESQPSKLLVAGSIPVSRSNGSGRKDRDPFRGREDTRRGG